MLFNHLKISWRRLRKHKTYSLINIVSLVLGMTCAFLIFLYIQDEGTYDRFHEKHERIVRLTRWFTPDFKLISHFARCPYAWEPWMNTLKEEYPEIETMARLSRKHVVLQIGENLFSEDDFFFTDKEVFHVFTIPFIAGDKASALEHPLSIIMTESMAKKYIAGNALGQTLNVTDAQGNKVSYKITGIMKDWPVHSHIQVHFLASCSGQDMSREWAYTYLLLRENIDYHQLEQKLPDFIRRQFGENAVQHHAFFLQKITDIHLHSHLDRELEINGDADTINILWIVTALIILVTVINTINLTTAQAIKYGKEIGIRKAVGSTKEQVVIQSLTETMLIAICAGLLSFLCIQILLPEINIFTKKTLVFQATGKSILEYLGFVMGLGFFTGIYPAMAISRIQPLTNIRPSITLPKGTHSEKIPLRNVLVILQFCISAFLIICTFVLKEQLDYVAQKPLGFNKEAIVSIGKDRLPQNVHAQYQVLRNTLLQNKNIVNVSGAMQEPSSEIKDMGPCTVESVREGNNRVYLYLLAVDDHFIDLLGINLILGKNFSASNIDYTSTKSSQEAVDVRDINESPRTYIINETAMRRIGFSSAEKAIGKNMDWQNELLHFKQGPIVGVVKDFHFSTLHKEIAPYVLVDEPRFVGSILIKLKSENMSSTIKDIERTWNTILPETPFEYHFLDDLFEALYANEQQLENAGAGFTFIAIVIACLGLVGLVAHSTEQRTKEIGIRKVLGSSVSGILSLLIQGYMKWIIAGNLIAWPIAYYVMKKWLQNFAYRIDLTIWPFLFAGVLAMVIAFLTVSWQAVRAATANPVEALRYE